MAYDQLIPMFVPVISVLVLVGLMSFVIKTP